MGVLTIITSTIILVLVIVVMGQPILSIISSTQPLMDKASTTMMYGKDTNGAVIAVSNANAAGDLTPLLLTAVLFFMVIGFIVWLVMRAPSEPDFYNPYDQGGRFQ